MFNIQKAVGRLEYAPKQKEIEITDVKKGIGVFTPKPDKAVSFINLFTNLKNAGYTVDAAEITIVGKLSREGDKLYVTANTSGQKFLLTGKNVAADDGASVEVTGTWTTVGKGTMAYEAVDVKTLTVTDSKTVGMRFGGPNTFAFVNAAYEQPFAPFDPTTETKKRAPIRTTSPGLTVFKGGAVIPRVYFVKQHFGGLDVWRQQFDLSVSYTPSPRVQLEAEIPVMRTSFNDGTKRGSGSGLGNIMLWAKYRFFRVVKTWGDHQAAARFGFELPTGNKNAPTALQVNAPAFVRQQLTPISGGLSPHFDLTFSQAGGRVIFGGNLETIYRTERDGYRLGHEMRFNTDLEYVLFPRDYQKPGGELFLILETNTVIRGHGKLNSVTVPGSTASEFYVAPGLQFAYKPNFVIEGSIQLPVIRNTGPLMLKTDYNLLLGIRYLF